MPRLKSGQAWVVIDNSRGEYELWPPFQTLTIHRSLQGAKKQAATVNKVRARARKLSSGIASGTAEVARADEWAADITARAILGQVKEE